MTNLVKTGVLADSNPMIVAVGNMDVPMTVTLISAAGGRKIELSTTGDSSAASFYNATPDNTTTNMINFAVKVPITHIRVTGQAGDTYRVQ